jgi:tetratricopeptide (TPR) repeat protein
VDLDLFEARRDLLFLDVYSSATTVEESGLSLKGYYLDLKNSGLDSPKLEAEILSKLLWAAARSFNPKLVNETIDIIKDLDARCCDPEVRCRTARSLGIYECYRGRLRVAEQHLRMALSFAITAEDAAAVVDCYVGLTTLVPRNMSSKLVEEILGNGLPLAEQYADPWHIAALLCNTAVCYMYLRDDLRAEALLTRAQSTLETSGDVPDTSPSILYNLGFIAFHRGSYHEAERYWSQANAASQRDGVLSVRAECVAALGKLALRRGEIQKARQFAAQAVRLARRAAFLTDERQGLEELLARLRHNSGRRNKALRKLSITAESAKDSDIPLYFTARLTQLELLISEGLFNDAITIKKELVTVARELGATWWVNRAESVGSRSRSRQST